MGNDMLPFDQTLSPSLLAMADSGQELRPPKQTDEQSLVHARFVSLVHAWFLSLIHSCPLYMLGTANS